MDLIKLNNYTPPAPSTYDIEYSDVNGEESQVEDGTTYLEQIRADVPTIKVGWTNLSKDEVTSITDELSEEIVSVQYFYGTTKNAEMRTGSRSLKLKCIDNSGNTYWDLSFTLEG